MDDLNSVISSILGDPQKMEQLRNVAQSLGMNPGGPPPGGFAGGAANPGMNFNQPEPPPQGPAEQSGDIPNPNSTNNMGQSNPGGMGQNGMGQSPNSQNNQSGFNLGSLSKLAGLFGNFNNNSNDKNVQLLRALQPHISPSRAGRIDDAVRIMQLISAWPALRDSGLLGSLGNLFSGGGHK